MALIGTISGSNGTTTSAVTGSLIIASDPNLVTKPAVTVLFVSGAQTSIRIDDPSVIFKADTFISGAIGTDSYVQMKPVTTLQIPTNTSASYIYTSGSTNDIYFTQYQPVSGLINNTRLRWLEGTLTTGLLNGGIISTVTGTTTVSITAGAGIIVSQNAAITSDPYPTVEYVSWPAFVSSSLLYTGSAQITYLSIESGGMLAQSNSPPTLAQFKDRVYLGRVLHQTGSVTNGAINSPAMAYAVGANTFDFIRPFGPLKVSGHVLAASGSTLGLTKTAGDSYSEGRNYASDPSAPNTILAAADPALVDSKIYRLYVSGSTVIQDTGVGNAGYAVIDNTQYNNNGTLAAVGNSEWTNQRVFWFPKSVNRALFVYYGSTKYATLLEAVAGITTENFVEGDNTKGAAIFVGIVTVKGLTSNLSDTVNNAITQAGLFRGAGTGGGTSGGTTSPAGSTSYIQFNDGGAFGADANLTFNNISHALYVGGDITGSNLRLTGDMTVLGGDLVTNSGGLRIWGGSRPTTGSDVFLYVSGSAEGTSGVTVFGGNVVHSGSITVKNSSNTSVASISTNGVISGSSDLQIGGNITGSNLYLSGDIAVVGGDLTTTAATFNLVTGSATTLNIGTTATTISLGSPGGRTTIANDLAVGTGNIIGAPGAGANVMTLLSSGNIVAKLDVDNNAVGHKFIIQDYTGASQFSVGENGNAELTGSLVVTGSVTAQTGFSGSLTKLADGTNYLIAGSGVTLTTGSNGAVTFTYPAGSNVTGSFSSSTSWAFAHGMNSRFVVIQAYDTSYNQIIPQNITLVDNNNATITFPTAESGYAVASIGGVGSYAASSSYSLTASYVNPLVQTVQVTGSISVTQDITGSGIRLSGDLAVNGGDITSTAGTLNIAALTNVTNLYGSNLLLGATGNVNLSGSATIMNAGSSGLSLQRDGSTFFTVSGDATTVSLGATPGRTTANIFNSNVSTMNIGGAATAVNIGSGSGRTSVLNDLVLGTGNILVTNDATPITLISSGNIVAKLDINNNATGHKFDIQDWRGVSQFFVGEDGNAELSGSIVVSGSTTMGATIERLTHYQSTGSVIAFNVATDSIFYVNNPTADITANFTGLSSILNNRIVTPTVILSQSATGRIVSALQIDGTSQTINWANGVTPSATANKQEAFGFSLIRSGSAWKVLGQLSTYG